MDALSDILGAVLNPFVLVPLVLVLLAIVLVRIYIKNYIKVPSNRVAVFTGRGEQSYVRGGAKFRIPGLVDVRYMELEPFPINIQLKRAPSINGVPVNVDAVGLVRIGSSQEKLATAMERWLDADPESLRQEINALLEGSLRAIVATMTVEDLNNNREQLARGVLDEAGDSLANIGMEVDAFKIQSINDDNGYLAALGQARIAEVKRDADIATAEAVRDGRIRAAQATQEAEVAEAQAMVITAEAQRERDIKLAQNEAVINAERSRASQAGPLAEAEAKKAVGVAEQEAEAARVQARVEVERRRGEQEQQRLQADVIAPAEAERQAAIARAEGERQATILAGEAEAEARKASADAFRSEQQAEADGIAAKLKAEAEGKTEIAKALNAYTPDAARMLMLPEILKGLVDTTAAASGPISNIDKVVMIGGGANSGEGGIAGFAELVPALMVQAVEALRASGVDITELLGQSKSTEAPATVTSATSE